MIMSTIAQNAPLGVFDSGVGGLCIWQSLRALLPCEQLIYIADSAYAPYGQQSVATIQARARFLSQSLINRGAKAIVVACNTATVNAIGDLRQTFSLPIIGVEPAIKPAILQSPSQRIGVIATTQTIHSANFAALMARYAGSCHIGVQACPGLVEFIEAGAQNHPDLKKLLRQYLTPLIAQQIDHLVLGCTHYIFIKDAIRQVLKELAPEHEMVILSTETAVAKECQRRVAALDLLAKEPIGSPIFLTTGEPQTASQIFSQLLATDCVVGKLKE